MRISDWSSDVCSSDLGIAGQQHGVGDQVRGCVEVRCAHVPAINREEGNCDRPPMAASPGARPWSDRCRQSCCAGRLRAPAVPARTPGPECIRGCGRCPARRSEEHTSELQSLMRLSYAVFCLQKKNITTNTTRTTNR